MPKMQKNHKKISLENRTKRTVEPRTTNNMQWMLPKNKTKTRIRKRPQNKTKNIEKRKKRIETKQKQKMVKKNVKAPIKIL